MIASIAASFALIAMTLLAHAEAQQPPDDPQALAEFLMEKNAESMNALASISYGFTETYEQPPTKRQRALNDVRRGSFRGNSFGEFLEFHFAVPHADLKGKDLGVFAQTNRFVVNPEYAARWVVDWPNPAAMYYRDDTGAFSRRAESLMWEFTNHRPHRLAFGPGELPLKETLLKLSLSGKYEATARRLGGDRPNLFELQWGYVHPRNNGNVTATYRFTLDGDRGYLITHGESIYMPGMNLIEWDTELAQVEKVWYPKTISHARWTTSKHPATQPADMQLLHRSKTTINDMKVDQKFDDSQFQFVALGMPDGIVICTEEEDEHGGLKSFYVSGAELIPVEQAEGTELQERSMELMQRRSEAYARRKPIVPASQPSR
jgi:hypothetical protein